MSETAKTYSEVTSHCCKNLYILLLFLDRDSNIEEGEKQKYAQIIKAHFHLSRLSF
ncbi:putative phage abortive infection protein [Domibacillus robiginosus]|uniref:putative phage abortive infection protein n=1 Tax=Domibacillus robiginosus TaxID=1071054 RepID=UPI003CCBBE49